MVIQVVGEDKTILIKKKTAKKEKEFGEPGLTIQRNLFFKNQIRDILKIYG